MKLVCSPFLDGLEGPINEVTGRAHHPATLRIDADVTKLGTFQEGVRSLGRTAPDPRPNARGKEGKCKTGKQPPPPLHDLIVMPGGIGVPPMVYTGVSPVLLVRSGITAAGRA